MAVVKFTDADEYLAELELEAAQDGIDRDVVRVCFRHRVEQPQPFRSLAVLSSFVSGGTVVSLDQRCGLFFDRTDEAVQASKRGEEVAAKIRAACERLGLEVRAGVFEPG